MSRFVTPSLSTRCALWHSVALALCCATLAPAVAQVPGIHPDPAALEAWQLDEGMKRELEQARAAVAEAREAAMAAKTELEAAVTAKSQAQSQQSQAPATSSDQAQQTDSVTEDVNAAGIKTLKRLITELQAERMELLAHLTAEHPLILDAEMRLEEYQRQLAALSSVAQNEANAQANESTLSIVVEEQRTAATEPPPPVDQPATTAKQKNAEDSLRLEQALAKWESAQTDLDGAVDRESAAASRLAALMARHASNQRKNAEREPLAEPARKVATATSPQSSASPSSSDAAPSGSQPLVLAALAIALVIAALASIKLARATDQTLFSGADDAAAALSLPVVGVIPAGSAAAVRGSLLARHRTLAFLIQVLAAVAVFALVALMVQNPGAIWQFVSAPLDSWR